VLGRAAVGVAALAVAGCRSQSAHTISRPAGDPDAAALAAAREGELGLLTAYDAALKALPLHKRAPLQVERAIHAAHLAALPQAGTATVPAARPPKHLTSALRASAVVLRQHALDAVDGANAALLASIAASHTASAG
jgi:hypothetical protein